DGQTVLTGSRDGTARLWKTALGQPIDQPLFHQEDVWAAVFSPDGQTVLTGSGDKTARLWDAVTGKPLGPPLMHQGRVSAAVFSPDGTRILTGSFDGKARLWKAPSPVDGEAERIDLWIQVMTGMHLEPDGAVRTLDAPTWKRCQQQ